MLPDGSESRAWHVRRERVVDESRRIRVSIADVAHPDGHVSEQYVLRCPRAAMVLAVDDRERVLLIWRHRFVIGQWCWELPGGYVAAGEEPLAAAERELLEETGFRAGSLEHLLTYQPMTGMVDHECTVFLGEDISRVTEDRDVNEAAAVAWMPFSEALAKVAAREIVGVGTVAALLALHARRLEAGTERGPQ
jgi:ADP-ribose pyrophosphatase